MGLFDKIFKKAESASTKPAKPEAVKVADASNAVFAPVSGNVTALENVADPVFSSGAFGKGLGIEPDAGVIYAPVTGTISATTKTLHALGFAGDDGVEVLIHVGVDTVEMNGDGFESFVEQGQHVVAGEPVMTFDRKKIAAAGHPDTVIMAVTNTDDLGSVNPVTAAPISAGDVALTFSK